MLFDLESVRLQEGFRGLAKATLLETTPSGARFDTDEGVLEAGFYTPGVVRLRLQRAAEADYGMLVGEAQPLAVQVAVDGRAALLQAGDAALEISSAPARLRFSSRGKSLIESVSDRTIQGELRFFPIASKPGEWLVCLGLTSGEAIYGLGEKFGPLDKRGQLITSWNRDATGVNAEISYKNTPFAWSSRGWGLYVHTAARVTHGVGYAPWSHRSYILKIEDPNLDLFLIAGETPAALIEKYTWLTGRAPLPPLWSFGMWMSKAYYQTADELLEVARKLRQRRIPCDVITLDGRAWHKPETRFDFSWDPDRYPDPAGFVRRLQEMHLRLCLWEYPYLSTKNPLFAELDAKGYFLKNPDGSTYIHRWFPPPMDTLVPHLQPSGIIDFTNPEAYAWYSEMHRPLIEMGVAVMKTDYGEAVPEGVVGYNGDSGKRLHNIYSLLYNRCVFEAFERYAGKDQALVWGRAGWAGSQRYPIQWGGDPQSDWEGLAGSIRGGLSWGMSGAPFYTHDIGGFYGSQVGQVLGSGKAEAELYVRWAQAGILASHTRFHGVGPREPWEYGEEIEAIIRRWLGWRYRLIPYLQLCAQEASQSGLPVQRAMALAFPQEPPAWGFETQYLLGPALLVAPVIQPGGQVQVYLPAGGWYDLWSGERLEGPLYLERSMPLDCLPLYGREGATLLLGPSAQHTGELRQAPPPRAITFGETPFRLEL
jgi:alpha-D-xyloside xylohydrolase